MVETTTKNYGWTKPELQHSPTTWGGFLNTDLDSIDGVVFSNQQGIVPIGTLAIWPITAPPANGNWLICDGRSLSRSAPYDHLFAVIGTTFGSVDASHFNLPNLTQRFPLGAGTNAVGTSGGSFAVTLQTANLPVHTHTATQAAHTHVATQPTHVHPASDAGHQHYVNMTQVPHAHADSGHTHGASQPAHNHTVGGVSGPLGAGFAAGQGTQVVTGTTSSVQPAITVTAGSAAIQPINANVSIVAGNGNGASNWTDIGAASITVGPAQPVITVVSQTPAITVGNTGSGTSFNVVPPWMALYFIIRFQ